MIVVYAADRKRNKGSYLSELISNGKFCIIFIYSCQDENNLNACHEVGVGKIGIPSIRIRAKLRQVHSIFNSVGYKDHF